MIAESNDCGIEWDHRHDYIQLGILQEFIISASMLTKLTD